MQNSALSASFVSTTLAPQVGGVEMDVAPAVDALVVADLQIDGAADYVAAGQVFQVGCVALHEALAITVAQNAALAANAFGDKNAHLVDASGVKLEELHILQGDAPVQGDGGAVAGEAVGVAGDFPHSAKTAGSENKRLAVEDVQVAAVDLVGDDAGGLSVGGEQQVQHVKLIEEAHVMGDALLVERLQDHVAGAVGGVTGAAHGFFAEIAGMAAERPLGNLALGRTVEGETHMFQFVDYVDCFLAHDVDRILVGEVVAALNCVKGVPFGPILFEVAQGCADSPLRSAGMAAGRIEFGQDSGIAALAGVEGRHEPGAASADNDGFKSVGVDHLVLIYRSGNNTGDYPMPSSRPRPPAPRMIAKLPARISRAPMP